MTPTRDSDRVATLKFILGLLAGVAFAAAWYHILTRPRNFGEYPSIEGFLTPPIVKLFAGIVLSNIPKYRPIGLGVFASIPLTILVLAVCGAMLAF